MRSKKINLKRKFYNIRNNPKTRLRIENKLARAQHRIDQQQEIFHRRRYPATYRALDRYHAKEKLKALLTNQVIRIKANKRRQEFLKKYRYLNSLKQGNIKWDARYK